ncbi:MAG: SRPBCC domain-containing protein [Actinomycetota bacterium]|nr:SRPBCC domain-containing protein [Actinomycetota bacterium]
MTSDTESPRRLPRPDLSGRPHQLRVERRMKASPADVYRAWTYHLDAWFASPDAVRVRPQVDEPFYFAVAHAGGQAPHYGRFLALEPDCLVELTWVTGPDGTEGAETVVRVELASDGAALTLTRSGFPSEAAVSRHRDAWPMVLAHLNDQVATTS